MMCDARNVHSKKKRSMRKDRYEAKNQARKVAKERRDRNDAN